MVKVLPIGMEYAEGWHVLQAGKPESRRDRRATKGVGGGQGVGGDFSR